MLVGFLFTRSFQIVKIQQIFGAYVEGELISDRRL